MTYTPLELKLLLGESEYMHDIESLTEDRDRARAIAVELEQENAWLREQMAAAWAAAESDLPEACYHSATMEYYDDPCLRCVLRDLLTPPDGLRLDVIKARATLPGGAA